MTKTLKQVQEIVARTPELNSELLGTWLWISGDTKPYAGELKKLGCQFSGKKQIWYFAGSGKTGCKKSMPMDYIRAKYGNARPAPQARGRIEVVDLRA